MFQENVETRIFRLTGLNILLKFLKIKMKCQFAFVLHLECQKLMKNLFYYRVCLTLGHESEKALNIYSKNLIANRSSKVWFLGHCLGQIAFLD